MKIKISSLRLKTHFNSFMKNILPLANGGLAQRYATQVARFFKLFALKYPRGILSGMFALIIISAVCCFTVLRTASTTPPGYFSKMPSIYRGEKVQGNSPSKLQILMSLRAELQGLETKDSLSRKDSLRIEKLLSQLPLSTP